MDGYAVSGAPPWTVVAQVRAGDRALGALWPGTACEVATGAPVHEAALAVLPYEQSSRAGKLSEGQSSPASISAAPESSAQPASKSWARPAW